MVKLKWNHLTEAVRNNNTQSGSANVSNISVDSDFSGEHSWVMVKKQRINILIPRLPDTEQSSMLDDELDQKQGNEPSNLTNSPSQLPDENPPEVCPADANDELMSLVQETCAQSAQDISPPGNVKAIAKPRKLHLRKPRREDQVGALRPLPRKESSVVKFPVNSTVLKSVRPFQQSGLHVGSNVLSGTRVVDRMMRASNLERKIVKAGGLSRWLSSLGLEQFVTIFHGKKVSKFQLASLSMQKLKDMGAHAVGPRRKLIHAIECLCEPYCFQAM